MKKILMILLVMICLSFSGCGEDEKTEPVDLSLEKLAQDVVQNNDSNQAEEKEQEQDVESEGITMRSYLSM